MSIWTTDRYRDLSRPSVLTLLNFSSVHTMKNLIEKKSFRGKKKFYAVGFHFSLKV